MALPKTYGTNSTAGAGTTATVANGGTAVTGIGTAWNGVIKADDYFEAVGQTCKPVRIASVTDNTHLVLAEPWPGTALSGDDYEIKITYDGPEFQLRTRELLEDLTGAVMDIVAGDGVTVDSADPNNPVVEVPAGNSRALTTVATITDLKALNGADLTNGQRINLRGGASAADGKQGDVIYVSALATTGDDAIYFTPADSVGRFVREEYFKARVIDPAWFGTVDPTGVVDFAPAFNAAVAAFIATGGSRAQIVMPAGIFNCASTLDLDGAGTFDGSSIVLRGSGRGSGTTLYATHSEGPVLRIGNVYVSISEVLIDADSGRKNGSATDSNSLPNVGILIGEDSGNVTLSQVRVVDQPSDGILVIGDPNMVRMEQVTVTSCLRHGINIDNGEDYGGVVLTSGSNAGLVDIIQPLIYNCTGHALKAGRKAGTSPISALRVRMQQYDISGCATDSGQLLETAVVYMRALDSEISYGAIASAVSGMNAIWLENCFVIKAISNRFFVDTCNYKIHGSGTSGILIDGVDCALGSTITNNIDIDSAVPVGSCQIIPRQETGYTNLLSATSPAQHVQLASQMQRPPGSASTVAYGAYGDPNTGMYFPAADQIGFSTGGTQRLDISSAGVKVAPATALPAGGGASVTMRLSSSLIGVWVGSGAPTASAAKGSIYLRSDGSTTNNRAYINIDGGTTWTALTTVA